MRYALSLAPLLWASPAITGETDFTALTQDERQVFHAEIRAVLAEGWALGESVNRPAPSPYDEDIARDLGQIAIYSDLLFANGAAIALIVTQNCPDCRQAQAELSALTKALDLEFTLIDADEHSAMITDLALDTTPSYVLPDMMLRGHMPEIALRRYLQRRR